MAGRLLCFPKIIKAIAEKKLVLFMDEAVFSSKQVRPTVWYSAQKEPVLLQKKTIGFKAIAVAAAIDCEGRVVAHRVVDGAIDNLEFQRFLIEVSLRFSHRRKVLMLVDNLPVHKMLVVKERAKSLNIELVFNGTYSSTFNPIERLWAWSKQRFSKRCVEGAPYHH